MLVYLREEGKVRRTASLAFRSLSSSLALFNVPSTIPNMLLPRLRSPVGTVKSILGRFLLAVDMAAGAVGGSWVLDSFVST